MGCRLFVVGASIGIVAACSTDVAATDLGNEPSVFTQAASDDVDFAPRAVTVCIDGVDKPRGRFVVGNRTKRHLAIVLDSSRALIATSRVTLEPIAAVPVEFEPTDTAGSIEFRNETQLSGFSAVSFVDLVDVRALVVRVQDGDLLVTNPFPIPATYEVEVEGPGIALFDWEPGSTGRRAPQLQGHATDRYILHRSGDGPVRISISGPRCSDKPLAELPIIDVP
jgi:hypothetical protein